MMIIKKISRLITASIIFGGMAFTPILTNLDDSRIITSTAYAAINIYEGVGEYLMSDGETQEIAKQGAEMHAIRNAQEKAGIFVSSLTEVKDNIVTKDEIEAFTAGVVKIGEVKYKAVPLNEDGGYIKYIATVTVTIDTNDLNIKINEWLRQKSEDRNSLVEQNKAQQKIIDEQAERIKELEQAAINAKTSQEKSKINEKLKSIDKETIYINELEKGKKEYYKNNIKSAINHFNKAIEINPNGAEAYSLRGRAYSYYKFKEKDYNQAVKDLIKAVELNPNPATFIDYELLSSVEDTLDNKRKSQLYKDMTFYVNSVNSAPRIIDKINKMEINSDSKLTDEHYFNRVLAYYYLKDYKRAIDESKKSSTLFSKYYSNVLFVRGIAYYRLKDYDKAIEAFTESIKLHENYLAYNGRGLCYYELKDYRKAIDDFSEILRKDNGYYTVNAVIYYNRSEAYKAIGDITNAKADFEKAESLIVLPDKNKKVILPILGFDSVNDSFPIQE